MYTSVPIWLTNSVSSRAPPACGSFQLTDEVLLLLGEALVIGYKVQEVDEIASEVVEISVAPHKAEYLHGAVVTDVQIEVMAFDLRGGYYLRSADGMDVAKYPDPEAVLVLRVSLC